jgi:prepilin-type N-terminal cleavage/methylation domain-containing protein
MKQRAFTLLELIIVVVILIVLWFFISPLFLFKHNESHIRYGRFRYQMNTLGNVQRCLEKEDPIIRDVDMKTPPAWLLKGWKAYVDSEQRPPQEFRLEAFDQSKGKRFKSIPKSYAVYRLVDQEGKPLVWLEAGGLIHIYIEGK